jgi:hypothetical protein
MDGRSDGGTGRPWRPWTIWLAAGLGVLAAAVLIFVDLVGLVMGSWDTPAPGLHWLKAGIGGQCGLLVTAAGLLAVGQSSPARRRGCVLAAVAVVAAEVGWFVLTARLAGG